jgi:hypothetical protein
MTGWRLRLDAAVGDLNQRIESYWMKTPASFRLVAVAQTPWQLGERALRLAADGKLAAARRWLDWAREILASGEHVHYRSSWQGLWPIVGREPTPADVESAAAAMALLGDAPSSLAQATAKKALPGWPTEARERALMTLAFRGEPAQVLPLLDAARATGPDLALAHTHLLERAGRHEEAHAQALALLAPDPGNTDLQALLASIESTLGRFADAEARLRPLVAAGNDRLANNYAWLVACCTKADADAERAALRAVAKTEGSPERQLMALNTLAYVQLALGKLGAAAATMDRAIADGAHLTDPDRLLLGRLAEALGYPRIAADWYRLIPPSELDQATSVYRVAQARLAQLHTE